MSSGSITNTVQDLSDTVSKKAGGFMDLLRLTYSQFIAIIEESNILSQKLKRSPENVSYHFEVDGDSDRSPIFWKMLVRILCFKLINDALVSPAERTMKLKEFLMVYRDLKTLHSAMVYHSDQDPSQSFSAFPSQSAIIQAGEDPIATKTASKSQDKSSNSASHASSQQPCSSSSTSSTPTVTKSKSQPTDAEECIICLERLSDITLPCAHAYCNICIKQWLLQRPVLEDGQCCPLCRGHIGTEENAWQLVSVPDSSECQRDLSEMVIQRLQHLGQRNNSRDSDSQ